MGPCGFEVVPPLWVEAWSAGYRGLNVGLWVVIGFQDIGLGPTFFFSMGVYWSGYLLFLPTQASLKILQDWGSRRISRTEDGHRPSLLSFASLGTKLTPLQMRQILSNGQEMSGRKPHILCFQRW